MEAGRLAQRRNAATRQRQLRLPPPPPTPPHRSAHLATALVSTGGASSQMSGSMRLATSCTAALTACSACSGSTFCGSASSATG